MTSCLISACNTPCVIDGAIGAIKNFNGMSEFVIGNGKTCENMLCENIEKALLSENISINSTDTVKSLFSISANKERIRSFIKLCLDHPKY